MSKRNSIIYWVSTIWLALGMVSTGMVQLLHAKEGAGGANDLARLGYPEYVLTILAGFKLIGVLTVLVPARPLLKEWAYAGFFFVMVGAICSHIAVSDPVTVALPAVLLLSLTVVSWYYRPAGRRIMQPHHS